MLERGLRQVRREQREWRRSRGGDREGKDVEESDVVFEETEVDVEEPELIVVDLEKDVEEPDVGVEELE